jgi:hypothetical protein
MLHSEILVFCFQIHTKHINTLCGQNVELYIKIQSVPRSKHARFQIVRFVVGFVYTNQSVNAV